MQLKQFETKTINLIFYIVLFLFFSPVVILTYLENKILKKIEVSVLSENWKLFDGHSDSLILENINLPKDLANVVSAQKEGKKWVLKKNISKKYLEKFSDPLLFFGKIGDSDVVTVGKCEVGRTGVTPSGQRDGWWWWVGRYYSLPKNCLGDWEGSEIPIQIEIYKWAGPPTSGIFQGPVGVGEKNETLRIGKLIEWIRFELISIFGGVFILGVALYYGFVFLLTPQKIYYGIFSLASFFTGVFNFFQSSLPYQVLGDSRFTLLLNIIFAALSSSFIIYFLCLQFKISINLFRISIFGGIIAFVSAISIPTFVGSFKVYFTWFPFLIVLFMVAFFCVLKSYKKSRLPYQMKYVIGYSLFIITCFIDIASTLTNWLSFYLIPYGFIAFFMAVSWALAEESADAFHNVEVKVTERTQDLAAAMDQLKGLEKMKERFFANVSHDFKTPLAVALGSIDEIKSKKSSAPPEETRALFAAERSLTQLHGMINDLLDTVKSESGTLKMHWEKAPLAQLLQEWTLAYEVLCKQKNLKLVCVAQNLNALMVPMDVSKIQRCLQNLISNAIKFTSAAPEKANTIEVRLSTSASHATLEVSDSGMGIPEDEKSKIFDRYFQSSKTQLKEHGGSGIGLSFVKEMMDLHNGTIEVKNSVFGGTTFVLNLPLSQNVEIVGTYSLEEKIQMKEVLKGSLDVVYPPENPSEEIEGLSRILIAEDNPEVAQTVYQALKTEYNIYFAVNGVEALKKIHTHKFDLLLTDIGMPQMRGDELVEEVRKIPHYKDLPIVVLSSFGDDDTILSLLERGASDYVTKPFRRGILKGRINAQLERHKTSRWIAQNEKVIEMGVLASGMAHQIRNGLQSLKNQFTFLKTTSDKLLGEVLTFEVEKKKRTQERLNQSTSLIDSALNRIERLTESINTYSSGSKQSVEIKLKDSISLALALQEDEIKKTGVSVVVNPNVEHQKFMGYATFHEVIMNLISNAIAACAHDGSGKIEVDAFEDAQYVLVHVKDNGKGIAPHLIDKLCQPFFTTKAPGEGTGLGLYIVRDIVEGQHNGKLTILSEGEGKGAEFKIQIPKTAQAPVTNPEIEIHNVKV